MQFLYPWLLALLLLIPALAAGLFLVLRRAPGPRRVVALVLRAVAVALLVVALAGIAGGRAGGGVDVVFAIDGSDSISPEASELARSFTEGALAGAAETDRAGIVHFAGDAAIERSLQSGITELTYEAVVESGRTSISDGILTAVATFVSEGDRRIVLLSDGNQTDGSAARAAQSAGEAGITVDVLPLPIQQTREEVFVRSVSTRGEVSVGEVHELRVVVGSVEPAQGTVTVYRDGAYYGEERLRLAPGDNVVTFPGVFTSEGVHEYTVTVDSGRDAVIVNNRGLTTVRATGAPAVLYVSDTPAPGIQNALETQGVGVRHVSVEDIPTSLEELVRYEAVIFDNVPAFDLSVARMEAIEQYVKDTGGGFVMLGGDVSFGAGGYYRTPIERVLPVDMDVTSSMKIPSLAMVFVIDKSGSMGSVEVSGATKLDLVKEAVIASVEIMNPYYTVGLLAFDADFEWTVPLVRAGERQRIVEDLSLLSSGGGTVLEGALDEARIRLSEIEAAVKHLIVLSDGLTSDAEFEPIINRMRDNHITVTTVSIGSSANRELMQKIAEWGGGRSYHTTDTRSIPQIFASETTIVSRNLIVEETFFPGVQSSSPIIRGVDTSQMPALRGFVLTYQKPGADQILSAIGGNPLLSSRQYGLGRSVAFTSDLRSRWGVAWLDWPNYPRFVAQMVRWVSRERSSSSLDPAFRREGARVTVTVDATNPDGSYRNLLDLSAVVRSTSSGTDEPSQQLTLRQVAPGRYEGSFTADRRGTYLVTVVGPDTAPQTFGYSISYPSEYLDFQTNYSALSQIAVSGGGRVLRAEDAATIFQPTDGEGRRSQLLYPYLVLAAVLVLLLELLFKQVLFPARATNAAVSRRGDTSDDSSSADERRGRRRRGTPETDDREDLPSYEEVRRQVAHAYHSESREKRDFHRWFEGGEHNPVAERKVHVASKTQRRTQQ